MLLLGCLLQRRLVTTEGHHGTNRQVFYVVQMDGGDTAAKALAEQHRLQLIQQVSACFKTPGITPTLLAVISKSRGFKKAQYIAIFDFFFKLQQCLSYISPHSSAYTHTCIKKTDIDTEKHI